MTSLITDHLITLMILVPFIGTLGILICRNDEWSRRIALVTSLVNLGLAAVLWSGYDPTRAGMQFTESVQWMPAFNIRYSVGVDGISTILVLLTTLLAPLCVLASWKGIATKVRAFMSLILLVQSAMVLVFTATDLFLLFMAWEVTMMPMYFMITLWGGPNRVRAGIKFVLYSLTGSLLLLVGILWLYHEGGGTVDLRTLIEAEIDPDIQRSIFIALFLGFAIKLPMLPFHSWLPDAHSEAPTAGSAILAGILLKMGGYGFVRICLPVLPEASAYYANAILWLSVAAILYGGFLALAQSDIKKLIAYSSISHMGFVTLGIFAFNQEGIEGAVMQMFNHGMTTGALFLAIGLLYDRTHKREISDYGGLHKPMPRFVVLLSIFSVASFGLPGTANFVGEYLVLLGSAAGMVRVLLAMGGIVLAAAYMLWMLQRVALGPVHKSSIAKLPDLTPRELATLVPLAVLVFAVGVYPGPLLDAMDLGVRGLLQILGTAVPGPG